MRKLVSTILFVSLSAGAILVFGCRQLVPEKRVDHTAPVTDEAWMNLRMERGSDMLYSSQQLKPEGKMIDFGGRFCSIALARGSRFVLVKSSTQLVSVDADAFKGVQETVFPYTNGGSMHGLTVSADGGIAEDNLSTLRNLGFDIAYVGSALFDSPNPKGIFEL